MADPIENLSRLALFISSDVRNAMQASFITFVADRWFGQFPRSEFEKRFRRNPGDTLTHKALTALEMRSVVSISEHLKDEHNLHPIVAEIRRKHDLKLHRHVISHPATVVWDQKRVQEFVDADRDVYDWRAAQIWDLQCSINSELRKAGKPTFNDTIQVTEDMTANLHVLMDQARLPAFPIPPVEAMHYWLQTEAPVYQRLLEKHPDGARDPEKEKARAERKRLRKERWAALKNEEGTK